MDRRLERLFSGNFFSAHESGQFDTNPPTDELTFYPIDGYEKAVGTDVVPNVPRNRPAVLEDAKRPLFSPRKDGKLSKCLQR